MDCKRIKQNCPPVSTWTFTSTEPVELLVLAAPQSSVCSTSQSDQSRSWETCNIICCRFYKFVLVFEPYMCQHFVSDLIWAVLSTDMVPVVFGKEIWFVCTQDILTSLRVSGGVSYSKLLPRGSYIDALNQSPKNLAHFLRYLDKNEELYNNYIQVSEG